MPLVDIWTIPTFKLEGIKAPRTTQHSQLFMWNTFASHVPHLIADNAEALGLDKGPVEGVQVMFHEFGEHDLNVPDVWIKIVLTECHTQATRCEEVRDTIIRLFNEFFRMQDMVPRSVAYDIFWGPGHGYLRMNGKEHRW